MKTGTAAWPAAGLFLVSALAPSAACADHTVAHEVRCAEIAFSLAAERRDRERFRASLDPEARFVGRSVMTGPEEVLRGWEPFFRDDGPRITWRPQFVEVVASGDLAFTRGPFRIDDVVDGKRVTNWGTFNSTWRRDAEGRWKVLFDAGNSADEAPEAAVQALLEQENDCPDPA